MTLKEKIDAYKKGFQKKAPEDAQKIMRRATEDLRHSGIMDGVVKVGDAAPEFTLNNMNDQPVSLKDVLAKGPMVLGFYRGRWWPYCNLELEALAKSADDFEASGASLVFISPMLAEHNRAFAEEKNLCVPILSDPGNGVADRYGLRYQMPQDLKQVYQKFGIDLPKHNGEDSWTLPMPARLIIDGDGIIRYAEINPDYTQRPEPEETLDAVKKLK